MYTSKSIESWEWNQFAHLYIINIRKAFRFITSISILIISSMYVTRSTLINACLLITGPWKQSSLDMFGVSLPNGIADLNPFSWDISLQNLDNVTYQYFQALLTLTIHSHTHLGCSILYQANERTKKNK